MNSSYLNCAEAEQTGGSRVNMVGGAAAGPDEVAAGSSSVSANQTNSSIETDENNTDTSSTVTVGAADPESESSEYTKALISIINSIFTNSDSIQIATKVINELKSNSVSSLNNA